MHKVTFRTSSKADTWRIGSGSGAKLLIDHAYRRKPDDIGLRRIRLAAALNGAAWLPSITIEQTER